MMSFNIPAIVNSFYKRHEDAMYDEQQPKEPLHLTSSGKGSSISSNNLVTRNQIYRKNSG